MQGKHKLHTKLKKYIFLSQCATTPALNQYQLLNNYPINIKESIYSININEYQGINNSINIKESIYQYINIFIYQYIEIYYKELPFAKGCAILQKH